VIVRDPANLPSGRIPASTAPTYQSLPVAQAPRLPPSNRMVFNGGGTGRARSIMSDQRRLLTDGDARDVVRHDNIVPLLASSPASLNDDSIDDHEPENKRQRTDEYEIALAVSDLPRSYAEAIASPEGAKWKEAIRREIRSHVQNRTWDLVTRPRGAKVIGCKWVFARKYDEHGNIARYKARLVAQGFHRRTVSITRTRTRRSQA
jgi:hypothetical protein